MKSADIPGLSNYLLGYWLSTVNVIAVVSKVLLLAVILAANITINDKQWTNTVSLDATFKLDPSNDFTNRTLVMKIPDRMRACSQRAQTDKTLIAYYPIRFNLTNNQQLENDFVQPGNNGIDLFINDSTVVCMLPNEVPGSKPLIVVSKCTRAKNNLTCLDVVGVQKDITMTPIPTMSKKLLDGEIDFDVVEYNEEDVQSTFSEYVNPTFTCLSTRLDHDGSVDSNGIKITHCLLVAFNKTKIGKTITTETIVERWFVGPDEQGVDEKKFEMSYPGVVFNEIFNISRLGRIRYLRSVLPDSDFLSLSGDLITQSAVYEYLGKNASAKKFERVDVSRDSPVSTINIYVIALVISSAIIVLVAFFITQLVVQFDKRPRFNTINGLSCIVQEQFTPSGRSLEKGKQSILGLRFTNDDKMHFGPLSKYEDAQVYQDGYDVS